jgi:surface carbohydrate biosynthesis protein
MNIYLHVEISVRELDSKLLLAILAASRGHQVIVSDLAGLEKGVKSGVLAPGIFHTKSLSPHKEKIARHKNMIDKGFMITSIDEEGNLNDYGYQGFAKTRYSDETIEQSTAVFGWGSDDVDTLKQTYSKHSNKIYKTGSPRADLWKPFFSDYWNVPSSVPKKPFLLISCNTGYANNIKSFGELIKFENEMGRFQSYPEQLEMRIGRTAEDFNKILEYIKAIKYLSDHNNGYDIVLRPHPSEDIEAWKIILKGIPNVHVIREGSINAWVNNAFAVMHNSCTTALEATVLKKPVVTYTPFKQKYSPQLANELGYRINSLEELLSKVNTIYDSSKIVNKRELNDTLPNIISNKIFFDDELAAEKIIKIWENIANNNLSSPSNLKKFKMFLKYDMLKKIIKKALRSLLPEKFNSVNKNPKFSDLDQHDINERIKKFQKILGLSTKIECKLLSKKTIHIKCL